MKVCTRKWNPTPDIDATLTRIYVEEYDKRLRRLPTLRAFAKKIGWPREAVIRRAVQLCLTRTKETPWSEVELDILNKYAHLCPNRIQLRLKKSGWHRTVAAIHLKRKRLGYRGHGEHYSSTGLSTALGIDAHVTMSWIRQQKLKATPKGTARLQQQGGDIWLIKETEIRRFLIEHPNLYDLRKVDHRWFLYIITGGKVAA